LNVKQKSLHMTLPRGRFAPSPTGSQHVGNARTYLLAWLSARSQGGSIVLRIEDIDTSRNKPYATAEALEDLRWLGFDWDGEPVIQSQRLPAHRAALEELQRQELVYPCTCSRNDIAQAASAPHVEHEAPTYPGTCASRRTRDADSLTTPFAWRFRVRHTPVFTDRFLGKQELDLTRLGGDFVVWRSANVPAYQLAVVVDDAAAGVSEVIRGDDLLNSTPRQLLLYEALGFPPPTYTHVPLVVGEDGHRLAKRHGDTRLSRLRKSGVTPEAFLGLLGWSCGWWDEHRPATLTDLLARYRLEDLPRTPFILTQAHLAALGYRED
jgi:glutamyl-tRNA synthetase